MHDYYLLFDVFLTFFFFVTGLARRDFKFFLLTSVSSRSNDDLFATILAIFPESKQNDIKNKNNIL